MTTLVEDIIASARNFEVDLLGNAQTQMGHGIAVIQGINAATPGTFAFNNNVPVPGDPGAVPAWHGATFSDPGFTTEAPTLRDPGDLELPADVGAPPDPLEYVAPATPTGEPSTELIGPSPELNEFPEIPEAPDLLGAIQAIQVPPILAVTLPGDPAYHEPSFDGIRPDSPATPPTSAELQATLRTAYTTIGPVMRDQIESHFDAVLDREFPQFRTGMAAIETRLATYLTGGTALSATVENQLYARALDKTNAEFAKAQEQTFGLAARAGQTMIGPTLAALRQDADLERRNANNRASIDIAIKQAELEQANLQFAVTQSINLRQVAIGFISNYIGQLVQLNGQALDYARALIDAVVKAYEIAARHAEIQARIYEADARIYESRLKGAMAAIEVYLAKIRGLEAKVNVNVAQVNMYKARIEAVQAQGNVYRAVIDALTGLASMERLKVDLFQARVSGFVAQENAYIARWNGFTAQVGGERAKQEVSVQQLRGYQAQIEANNSIIDGRTKAITARAAVNEQLLRAYETAGRVYSVLVQGKAAVASAEVTSFDTTIKAFLAKAGAVGAKSQAQMAAFYAGLNATSKQAEIQLAHLREVGAIQVAKIHGVAQVASAAGAVWGNVAQSVGSGMNTLAAQINNTET